MISVVCLLGIQGGFIWFSCCSSGCSQQEALMLTKHQLSNLYVPHWSFISTLSLDHGMFVLPLLSACPALFWALSSQEGKPQKVVKKTRGEPESMLHTAGSDSLYFSSCLEVDMRRDTTNVQLDKWLKRRMGYRWKRWMYKENCMSGWLKEWWNKSRHLFFYHHQMLAVEIDLKGK